MVNASLPAASGWPSVETLPGWPAEYATFVMEDGASRVIPGNKNETCAMYLSLGIDQRFWWCD